MLREGDQRAAEAPALVGGIHGDVLELEPVAARPDHEDTDDPLIRDADPDLMGRDERGVIGGHWRGRSPDSRDVVRIGRLDDCRDRRYVSAFSSPDVHARSGYRAVRPGTRERS